MASKQMNSCAKVAAANKEKNIPSCLQLPPATSPKHPQVVKMNTYNELNVDVNLFPCMMKQQCTFLSCCVDDRDIVVALLL
jgi:hypothetical protein